MVRAAGRGPAADGSDRLITPIARFAVRYAVPVLVGWALVVVTFGIIGRGVEEKVQPSLLFIPGTESDRWRELREGSFNENIIVLLVGPRSAGRPPGPGSSAARARATPEGTRVISPWSGDAEELAGAAPEPAPSGHQRRPAIPPDGETSAPSSARSSDFVQARVRPPVEAHLAGIPSLGTEVNEASIEALHKGELIAAPLLIIVLLLVFRSPVAAAIPLAIAVGTVAHGLRVICR